MKKGIVIGHNNGLGDLIVMNGCVRYLASQYDVAYLTCFNSRLRHYEFIYRDADNIKLFTTPHPKNSRQARLRQVSSFESIVRDNPDIDWSAGLRRTYWTTFPEWNKRADELGINSKELIWPKLFYAIMRTPYETRYTHYHVARDYNKESSLLAKIDLPKRYAFCVGETRKFKYEMSWQTDLPIINPLQFSFWKDTLIFDWIQVIENAAEIHTVDTSWMHMIRMLQLDVPKYYYQVRDLVMIGNGYLNDNFDSGWSRVNPKDFLQQEKRNYWLT